MKKITSLNLVFSFIIMTYTGIMLFLAPKGKIAYWGNWELFGLSRDQYAQLHTTSMIVFTLFGILHIYNNWNPIVSYLKNKHKSFTFSSKEFFVALIINVIFVIGTLGMIQPFSGFLHFEDSIKESWAEKFGEPPYGHAEMSSLKAFCKKIGIDLKKAEQTLQENNIKFDANQKLKTIAKNNNMSPNDIYILINNENNEIIEEKVSDQIPESLGKKSLYDLKKLGKIDIKNAMSILSSKGLTNISKDTKLKEIADSLDMTPMDIYQLITKK